MQSLEEIKDINYWMTRASFAEKALEHIQRDRRTRLVEEYAGRIFAGGCIEDRYNLQGAVKIAIALADAVIEATKEEEKK